MPSRIPDGAFSPRILVALFLLAWLTYANFTNGMRNPNTFSRLALAMSLAEFGEVAIDPFANFSEDQSFFDGHYYSNKAPGMSFLVLPVVAATGVLFEARNPEAAAEAGYPWVDGRDLLAGLPVLERYTPVFTSGPLTALEVVALYVVGVVLTGQIGAALFAALVFGFGTPAWGWATTIFGHAAGGAFLFFAFALVHRLGAGSDPAGPADGRDVWWAALAGVCAAAAITIEYTAAPATLLIALYGLWRTRSVPAAPRLRMIGAAAAAGACALAPLLAYHTAAFGTPFTNGYAYQLGFQETRSGFFGIGIPDPKVLGLLLLGDKRGLLWLSPILLLTPLALHAMWQRGHRATSLLLTSIGLCYFLMNAGYVNWGAGWSTGPRYVTASLGFLCLPFAVLWQGAGRALRATLVVLFAVSALFSLASASVTMTADWSFDWLLWDFILPRFLAGDVPAVFLGHRLPGLTYLVPLLAFWALAAWWLAREIRRAE